MIVKISLFILTAQAVLDIFQGYFGMVLDIFRGCLRYFLDIYPGYDFGDKNQKVTFLKILDGDIWTGCWQMVLLQSSNVAPVTYKNSPCK